MKLETLKKIISRLDDKPNYYSDLHWREKILKIKKSLDNDKQWNKKGNLYWIHQPNDKKSVISHITANNNKYIFVEPSFFIKFDMDKFRISTSYK